ncbi:hypothetical protein J6590_082895 [Homalodisca vitripennis]|nr:hypothetical protein J6590_082895 [Homalodisca vitripennis]
MEGERVFSACTDYAPVPAGLFESLSTQVRRLTKIESTVDYCLAITAIKSGLYQIPSAKTFETVIVARSTGSNVKHSKMVHPFRRSSVPYTRSQEI